MNIIKEDGYTEGRINNIVTAFSLGKICINLIKLVLENRDIPCTYNKPRFVAMNLIGEGKPAVNEWYSKSFENEQWYQELQGTDEFDEIVNKLTLEDMCHEYNANNKVFEMKIPYFPRVTFLLFATGKVVQGGAFTPEHAVYAALQFSIFINEKLNISTKVEDFVITNIVMSIKRNFELDLIRMSEELGSNAIYEPIRFPAVRIRGLKNKNVMILGYRSSAMVTCGAYSISTLMETYYEMHKLSDKYRETKIFGMSQQQYRLLGFKKSQSDLMKLNEQLQIKSNPLALTDNQKQLIQSKQEIQEKIQLSLGSSSSFQKLKKSDLRKIKKKAKDERKKEEIPYLRNDKLNKKTRKTIASIDKNLFHI